MSRRNTKYERGNFLIVVILVVLALLVGLFLIKSSRKPGGVPFKKRPLTTTTPGKKVVAPSGLICVTGVAVPKEESGAGNAEKIRQAVSDIKGQLGITVVWQLFERNSTEADWFEYFKVAKEEGIQVLVALTEADNYVVQCSGTTCDLDVVGPFLTSVKNNPNVYDGVLFGVLLVDEPLEDPITTAQLKSLYSQGKAIAPNVPLIIGWSKELYRLGPKADFEFSDGMADIHLISALEVRDGSLREEILIPHQKTSRSTIRSKDPDAKIFSSVQVFGNTGSKAAYSVPTADILNRELEILLNDSEVNAAGTLDGLMWQSWVAPTTKKIQGQQNLSDPPLSDLREIAKSTCAQ